MGPNYQRPKTDVPGGYRGVARPPLPVAASSESLGDAKWWTVFQDEQLQALIRTALKQNYDVRIAAERVLAAQAQLRIARSDQYPSAGVGSAARPNASPPAPFPPAYRWDYLQVGGAASWDIDFWGKYRRATEAARANLAQTEWGKRAVVSTLVANVASAYFQLRALDLELEITQRTLASRQESLRLTKLLADQGAASMVDVRQAEQLVYVASATLPDLERQIEQEENYIRFLLAQNPGPITRGRSLTEQVRPPVVPAGLPSQLLERRPDIHEAEQQLIAANAQIGVARAAYFPSISLTGTAGFMSSALVDLFAKPAGAWDAAAASPSRSSPPARCRPMCGWRKHNSNRPCWHTGRPCRVRSGMFPTLWWRTKRRARRENSKNCWPPPRRTPPGWRTCVTMADRPRTSKS